MSPQEKRLKTIKERFGSVKNMLKKRDVRDLILGGYNGGLARTQKGFATWETEELKRYAQGRPRDSKGRFLPKEGEKPEVRREDTQGEDVR